MTVSIAVMKRYEIVKMCKNFSVTVYLGVTMKISSLVPKPLNEK